MSLIGVGCFGKFRVFILIFIIVDVEFVGSRCLLGVEWDNGDFVGKIWLILEE